MFEEGRTFGRICMYHWFALIWSMKSKYEVLRNSINEQEWPQRNFNFRCMRSNLELSRPSIGVRGSSRRIPRESFKSKLKNNIAHSETMEMAFKKGLCLDQTLSLKINVCFLYFHRIVPHFELDFWVKILKNCSTEI